jgi:hypothetical protein
MAGTLEPANPGADQAGRYAAIVRTGDVTENLDTEERTTEIPVPHIKAPSND